LRERCTPRPGEQPASKARRSDASGSLKIEFVNHASFVCETNGLRIISDPWLDGMAFNNGWALLSPTKFSYEDFRNITHIWISHEHPDHFSPPNLKKIPESCRERITILFQETKDKRVVNFLRSIGFSNFIDLPSDRWVELKPGVEVLCAPIEAGWGEGDSWMCLKTPEATLLNINDCDMQRKAGGGDRESRRQSGLSGDAVLVREQAGEQGGRRRQTGSGTGSHGSAPHADRSIQAVLCHALRQLRVVLP
jgi:hypothetical protein